MQCFGFDLQRCALCALLIVSPVVGVSQTAPASPIQNEETTVKLDPFSVSADSDVGFVAASSLAGGRIATALKDTPVAYSVITKEFLEAFNVTDVAQAAQFSVNTNYHEGDGSNQGFGGGPAQYVRIRGQLANAPTRNFFPYVTTSDSFNLDRVDFARGANAILFGAGGAGGTQNTVTKQANPSRTIREVRFQAGSWSRYRMTADVNQPITDKLALRTNLLWASGDTWHDYEWEDRVGAHFAATNKVAPQLTIRAEFEYRSTKKLQGWQVHRDQVSAWDGRTTPNGVNPALSAAVLARAGIARFPSQFVSRPDWGPIAMNFQNQFRTTGAAYNAVFANTNYLDDMPIRTVGFSLRNEAMIDVWNPANRFAGAVRGAPGFRLPGRHELAIWGSSDHSQPTFTEYGRDAAIYATYAPTENLFFELAADTNNSPRIGDNSGRRGIIETYIDINRTLPSGEINPGFLRRYSDYHIYQAHRRQNFDNLRFQAAYVKSTNWGRLQGGVMAGWQEEVARNHAKFMLLPLYHLGPDFRTFVLGSTRNQYAINTRIYHDESNRDNLYPTTRPLTILDPVTNVQSIGAPRLVFDLARSDNQFKAIKLNRFFQGAGNFDLFKNRLVMIGAFRRDFQEYTQNASLVAGDMPAGWDGTSLIYRTAAPDDYFDLTYVPKNAAGQVIGTSQPADTRPRVAVNGVQVRAAQYANDRFRDDYDAPRISRAVSTRTYGFVYNATRWLGIYANDSTTFNLSPPVLNLANQLIPPTSAQGYDAGVRITLPNGKLAASIGWYSAYQEGSPIRILGGVGNAVNSIGESPVVGDLSVAGQNVRGLILVGNNVYSTSTSITKGYEAEITANLTPSWRLVLNAATTDARDKDPYPDIPGFIERNDAVMRQILGDSGVIIGANNLASINPTLNDPTRINQVKVQAAVDGWNNLQTVVIPTLIASRGPSIKAAQSVKLSGNLASDYRFRSGKLAGLRVGLALNYRAGQIVGSRVSDTIPDPNNPLAAIDDPAVDGTSYVYGSSILKATGTVSYTVRFGNDSRKFRPKSVQFDLNIDNLFNRGAPVYGFTNLSNNASTSGAALVPRNNDIGNPSMVSVPGNATYLPPRNYTLSAKFDF